MFKHPLGGAEFIEQMMAAQGPMVERSLLAAGPQRDPQQEEARLAVLEAFKHPFGSPEFIDHMRRALEAHGNPEEVQKFLAGMASWQRYREGGMGSAGIPPASGRFRFTEYCILPDHWYDVTGTCVENPSPKDEHDRNLIVKGQNEPTFLISWKSEKGIENTLRNRAALSVFGGAGLAIVCLGILLAKLGWF